ncbi:response regulator transcription factor [uncultured Tyzzerella sp.]|uniref:response regulator transcription factor n=1 Tax=uncultured Tyzzerella sp. TaxID=2321398 RepID=UPI002941CB4A|nr:response regulator transcription factor [uncultured Tyzzerella sp.]
MSYFIYVIEDDKNIAELLEIALKTYGYNVFLFDNAEDAIKNLNINAPDLIICDIMLPGIDGIEAVSTIRKNNMFIKTPIIMLTAKDSEIDKIKGLDSGADDYITKPFSVMEVMARIRAQFRKIEQFKDDKKEEVNEINLGSIKLNKISREVFVGNELIELTFKEYELLKYLLKNTNKPLSREEILNNVWGYEYLGETRTVDIHIKTIRRKLIGAEDYIKTIRGVGYKISEK